MLEDKKMFRAIQLQGTVHQNIETKIPDTSFD